MRIKYSFNFEYLFYDMMAFQKYLMANQLYNVAYLSRFLWNSCVAVFETYSKFLLDHQQLEQR